MTAISFCFIVKNEEKNIEKCLVSLKKYIPKDCKHELLVLDTGSVDNTVDVARNNGARVENFVWVNDFSAARNEAIKLAKYDYIMFLDADEYTESFDYTKTIELVNKYPDSVGQMLRRNLCNSSTGDKTILEDRVERLFNRKYYRYEGRIHEQVVSYKKGDELNVYEIPLTVYHEGYLGTPEELKAKAERNNTLLFEELREHPDDPYIYYQLAQSYGLCGDKENEYQYYRKCYDLNPRRDGGYVPLAITSLGQAMLHFDKKDEIFALIKAELSSYADYGDFLCMAGYAYMKYSLFEESIKMYKRALDSKKTNLEGSNTYRPAHNLACIYEALGDYEKAIEYFEQSYEKMGTKDRLSRLKERDDIFEKKMSIILYADDDTKVSDVLGHIENQSIGISHIEFIIVSATKNDEKIELLSDFENKYNNSVMLINVDKGISSAQGYEIGLSYASCDNIMFISEKSLLKWDAARIMCLALGVDNVQVVSDDINCNDADEFVLNIVNEEMRKQVITAGILRDGFEGKAYRKSFISNAIANFDMLINGCIEAYFANSIYCIRVKLRED